ncbi:MAG: DUF481 domain-containing protein [Armatimonadota bacterium]
MGRPVTVLLVLVVVLVVVLALVGGAVAEGVDASLDVVVAKVDGVTAIQSGKLLSISAGTLIIRTELREVSLKMSDVIMVKTASPVLVYFPPADLKLGKLLIDHASAGAGSLSVLSADDPKPWVKPVPKEEDWATLVVNRPGDLTIVPPKPKDSVEFEDPGQKLEGHLEWIKGGYVVLTGEGNIKSTRKLTDATSVKTADSVTVVFPPSFSCSGKLTVSTKAGTVTVTDLDGVQTFTRTVKPTEWDQLSVNCPAAAATPAGGASKEIYDTVTLTNPDPADPNTLIRRGKVVQVKNGSLKIEEGGTSNTVKLSDMISAKTAHPVQVCLPGKGWRTGLLSMERGPDGKGKVTVSSKDVAGDNSSWAMTKDDWKRLQVNVSEWKTALEVNASQDTGGGNSTSVDGTLTTNFTSSSGDHWGKLTLSGTSKPSDTTNTRRETQGTVKFGWNNRPDSSLYWYTLLDMQRSNVQHYQLRTDVSSGIGWHVIPASAGKDDTFDVELGPDYLNIQYDRGGLSNEDAEKLVDNHDVTLRVGGAYTRKLGALKFIDTFSFIGLTGSDNGREYRNKACLELPLDDERWTLNLSNEVTTNPDSSTNSLKVNEDTWKLGVKYSIE